MFDPTNPMISATMRMMRWEIAINFPGSNPGIGHSDLTMENYIRDWTDKYLVEKGNWFSEEPRRSMVNKIMEDMFGPQY